MSNSDRFQHAPQVSAAVDSEQNNSRNGGTQRADVRLLEYRPSPENGPVPEESPTTTEKDPKDTAAQVEANAKSNVDTIDVWRPADIRQWLREGPPEMKWIFRDSFSCGIVAGLSAPGGTGKSFFVFQLAISLAIGRRLFSAFEPVKASRVLVLLGEDSAVITHLRFNKIAQQLGLSPDEEELMHSNLKVYPNWASRS